MSEQRGQTATVHLEEGMRFAATGKDNVTVQMDSDAASGGGNQGFRPTELLMVSVGSCMGMDVISILRKKRQQVTDYRIEVRGTQREEYPRVFTDITMHHVIRGHDVSPDAVARAIELSETKYCSVSLTLSKAAKITTTFEILPAEPAD
jgi:putative redox protein